MIELNVGDYVYSDNYYGYVAVGVVTRVNDKTYTIRLEHKGWEVRLDKRTLCASHTGVFLPVSGKDAFNKIFDRETYVRRIKKLESKIDSLESVFKGIISEIRKNANDLLKNTADTSREESEEKQHDNQ